MRHTQWNTQSSQGNLQGLRGSKETTRSEVRLPCAPVRALSRTLERIVSTSQTVYSSGRNEAGAQGSDLPVIAMVIPVLDEYDALPENLRHVLAEPDLSCCIVVDGGSTDGTLEYLAGLNHPKLRVIKASKGRGRQMNVGARAADADYLLFHHADSRLHPGSITRLRRKLAEHRPKWGGFKHRFSNENWKLALISSLNNFRCRKTGAIYGDQSMFVERQFFWQMDGFRHQELEDLDFSERATQRVESYRLSEDVVTDSRKFKRLGELRGLVHVLSIIVRYQLDRRIGNEQFFNPYR